MPTQTPIQTPIQPSRPSIAWALIALCLAACNGADPDAGTPATAQAPSSTDDASAPSIAMDDTARQHAGIDIATAGPSTLIERATLFGQVTTQPERTRALSARYPGILRSIHAKLGEHVQAGATLATIQSNDSLTTYTVVSPIDGELIQLLAQPGETVGDMPILVVADLSTLRVELDVFPGDAHRIQPGQSFLLPTAAGAWQAPPAAHIDFLSPVVLADTQSRLAVGHFENPQREWAPGQRVMTQVVIARREATVTIPADAVQTLAGEDTVFVHDGQGFVPRQIHVGIDDGLSIEVVSGLAAGERVATGNTFLLKSEWLTQSEE